MKSYAWSILLIWLWVLGAGCASPGAAVREEEEVESSGAEWVDGEPICEEHIECVSLLCEGGFCWGVRCEEDEETPETTGMVVRTRGTLAPPVGAGNNTRRYWGSAQGLPAPRLPVFVIPWRHHDRQPLLHPSTAAAIRRHAEGPGRLVRHHLFPQAFKAWFKSKGINIHRETMLLEDHVHKDIHRGPNGGPWNDAWWQFIVTHDDATKEDIWRHAGELLHRFNINGPILPYYGRVALACGNWW
jgi:uncharacterized lipoprotein (TIGR02269 family)